MSAAALARQLKVPTNRITDIINGQRAVTGDTALRLAHFFGASAEFWLTSFAWLKKSQEVHQGSAHPEETRACAPVGGPPILPFVQTTTFPTNNLQALPQKQPAADTAFTTTQENFYQPLIPFPPIDYTHSTHCAIPPFSTPPILYSSMEDELCDQTLFT